MELEESTFLTSDYMQSYSHQDSMVQAQKQKYRQVKQGRKPMGTLSLTKARIYHGEKTASSISGAGKAGKLHVKE